MDNIKTHIAKNRLYFLQDLKALLEKHDAVLEVDFEYGDRCSVNFLYNLNGFDDPFDRQTGNILGNDGDFGVYEINKLIDEELIEIEDDKHSNN